MHLDAFNTLDEESAAHELRRCCGSTRWVDSMTRARPFPSAEAMADVGDAVWVSLGSADWLEAFAAHPRIGEAKAVGSTGPGGLASPKLGAVRPSEGGPSWEEQEQSSTRSATDKVRERLAARNQQYEARFGYIFIVCATGKTAEQMLAIVEDRLQNDSHEELRIAVEEQRQITRLRIGKLLEPGSDGPFMITTHVLDTARGGPAVGVTVILELRQASEWSPIGRGTTDQDGRVSTLTDAHTLAPGTYRLTFDTGTYHREQGISVPFFPEAKITFNVRDIDENYHVPLLLSPFGYTTYRGA
jgi:5-hydroxyisourate hydrolase/2-oxo-4-hydroxy-4-carboxy-5-ureidoimidazoline decarboxylase